MTDVQEQTPAPAPTTRWSLLADCSHGSAVAVGQRCRLAFHRGGLQAFGGYLEGFLPTAFAVEAVAGDDKILAFLQLSDDPVTLTAGKASFELNRGDATVRFEALPDIPLPAIPLPGDDTRAVALPPAAVIQALLDCVPKTGWGALNIEMLGVVLNAEGAVATDNTSLAWCDLGAPSAQWKTDRLILPRPFCLAYIHWLKRLGDNVAVSISDSAIYAVWADGGVLCGVLPADNGEAVDFSAILTACAQVAYADTPASLAALLDEAAIFADDIVIEATAASLKLSTAGPISWHRAVAWTNPGTATSPLTVPLKRLRTALDYSTKLSISDGRIHLSHETTKLYVVIATK